MPKHNLSISGTITSFRQADLPEYRPERVHVFIWKRESHSHALDLDCDSLMEFHFCVSFFRNARFHNSHHHDPVWGGGIIRSWERKLDTSLVRQWLTVARLAHPTCVNRARRWLVWNSRLPVWLHKTVLHSYNVACIVKFSNENGLNSHNCHWQCFHWYIYLCNIWFIPFINGLSDYETQLLTINKVQKKKRDVARWIVIMWQKRKMKDNLVTFDKTNTCLNLVCVGLYCAVVKPLTIPSHCERNVYL